MPGFTDGDSLNAEFVSRITEFNLKTVHCNFKPVIAFDHPDFAKTEITVKEQFNPMMIIEDKEAVIIGKMKYKNLPAAGYKKFSNHTSWYCSLPWLRPDLPTSVLKKTCAHIYEDQNDGLISGAGLISICTIKGGKTQYSPAEWKNN